MNAKGFDMVWVSVCVWFVFMGFVMHGHER